MTTLNAGTAATFVTRTSYSRTAPGIYRFDIRLQGDGETVFFDI